MKKAVPFEPPSQTCYLVESNRVVGTVTVGGPILKMPCKHKVHHFEMHRFFGPLPCNKDGYKAAKAAKDFWDQFDKWTEQGRLVSGDECVVD